MERRRLAGMKPVSLSHLFFENLSEKTRFWVIVVRGNVQLLSAHSNSHGLLVPLVG
jgi:hypothetical protein